MNREVSMGLLSKLKKVEDAVNEVNKAAGDLSKTTLTDYGEPAYSLYTALKLTDPHRKISITDEQGNVKYYTKSSFVTIKGKTEVMDADGEIIANLEKKVVSLHEVRFITMADGRKITLSNELMHVVKDVTNIKELGWQLQGNLIGLTFNLIDEKGSPVATVGKKAISVRDKYCIDIYQPAQEQVVVAIVVQLEKMLEDRAENESEGGASFSFGL